MYFHWICYRPQYGASTIFLMIIENQNSLYEIHFHRKFPSTGNISTNLNIQAGPDYGHNISGAITFGEAFLPKTIFYFIQTLLIDNIEKLNYLYSYFKISI